MILNLTQVHLKGIFITACYVLSIVRANTTSLVVLLVENLQCKTTQFQRYLLISQFISILLIHATSTYDRRSVILLLISIRKYPLINYLVADMMKPHHLERNMRHRILPMVDSKS